ncbi:hypothetical protein AB0I35_10810 [Nocardia sp. NPDC050378]|uniref:hypothetical protein n=1 Tax=Nocardia sp. NPDC050378 TaxID=3155400 RepID=UPI003402A1A2
MLIRRAAALAVAISFLPATVACQEDLPPRRTAASPAEAAEAMPAYWKTAPATDDDRVALLARLRTVDPCALISRTDLAQFGNLTEVENDDPDSCEATFGPADSDKRTRIRWSLAVAPNGFGWGESKRTEVDGISVGSLRDLDASPEMDGQLTERTCTATAAFANTAFIPLYANTPLGTEPCPIAERALARVMGGLAGEPPHGTSPDTPRTALLGRDPCEVATVLGVTATISVRDRRLWSCQFTFRDAAVDVDYTYDSEALVVRGEPIFEINGHKGYGDTDNDEYVSYTAVVGPALPSPGSTLFGPELPTIRVFGKDRAALEAVLRANTELIPAT